MDGVACAYQEIVSLSNSWESSETAAISICKAQTFARVNSPRLELLLTSSSRAVPLSLLCYFEFVLVGIWRRQWQPTPVLLPGKSHGWRSVVGCSPWGREKSDMTERLHFHFSLSCIGEGNGNPLQCSCLENPRDGGVWWAAVYGVAQSRTRLKRLSSSSSSSSSWDLGASNRNQLLLTKEQSNLLEAYANPTSVGKAIWEIELSKVK